MIDVIAVVEKSEKNKKVLVIKNVVKIKMAKVAKVLSVIDLESKYSQVISNIDIDTIENLELIGIQKYQKYIDQIYDKIDWLYNDRIFIFRPFIKHSQKIYNNKKITKNMIIRWEIDLKQALSIFISLYGSIYYEKMDSKDIVDAIKPVKKQV